MSAKLIWALGWPIVCMGYVVIRAKYYKPYTDKDYLGNNLIDTIIWIIGIILF